MKYLLSFLILLSITLTHRGAQSEDCSPFYIYDLSLNDLGTATLTDGQLQTPIDLSQPITYSATLCYSPTGIWIAGQFAPAGATPTVISLASGQHIVVEWVQHGIEIRDQTIKECQRPTDFPRTASHSVGRYSFLSN